MLKRLIPNKMDSVRNKADREEFGMQAGPLVKVRDLFNTLGSRNIRYCHWKSNFHLDFALRGEEDLDLLIAREDLYLFFRLLVELGYKEFIDLTGVRQLGVYHFLGHDEETGTLIHIHAFCRTLTGDHIIKSFALPFERMLLENVQQVAGVMLPTNGAELVVFVLRTLIKHTTFTDLLLTMRSYDDVLEEYRWLRSQNSLEEALALLARYFPEVDAKDFKQALELIRHKDRLWARVLLGRRFARVLAKYRRYSALESAVRTGFMVAKILLRRILRKKRITTMPSGGSIIAFVGPQATGKSTLARNVRNWFGFQLSVRYIHAGKPPATPLTFLPNLFLPLLRWLMPAQRSTKLERREEQQKDFVDYSYLHIVRKVMLAYDRWKLLQSAFRQSRNGKIIISDRYPSEAIGAVDGATFDDMAIRTQKSGFKSYLMALERSIYQKIPSPDIVIQLAVPLDVAIHRNQVRDKKGAKDSEYVRFRHTMNKQPIFTKPTVISVSTAEPQNETLKKVKSLIWKHL